MNLEKFFIPQHLDDAPRFLLWSMDEAVSILVPAFFGIVSGLGIFTPIVAIICYKIWKRVKGAGGSQMIKCMIYWYYPRYMLDLKTMPDSSIRKLIG